MRTIPDEVLTLLKSRCMIGDNKPSYEVTVEKLTGSWDLNSPDTVVYNPSGISTARHQSAVVLPDGRVLCVFTDGSNIKQGYAASVEAFFANSSLTDIATIFENAEYGVATVFEKDGNYYLHTVWNQIASDGSAKAQMWKLTDGAWVLYSTLNQASASNFEASSTFAGIPVFFDNRWVVLSTDWYSFLSGLYKCLGIYISTDDGLTWIKVQSLRYGAMSGAYATHLQRNIANLNGVLYFVYASSYSGGNSFLLKSTDYGSTWSTVYSISNLMIANVVEYNNKLYMLNGSLELLYAENSEVNTWTSTGILWSIAGGDTLLQRLTDSQAALFSSYGLIGIDMAYANIPIKSISISRNKNMAGSLNLSIDNKNGKWSPDNSLHQNILFPNKLVTVKQGYGANLVNTFTGLIDRIEMTTFPQELKLSVRDKLKLALDQTITWTDGATHVILFQSQTVEAIFTALCGYAGLTTGTIETTGLIITKTFSWETYADCFQWLADLVGFEYGADEDGKVYFKKDALPQATDWILTFTNGTAQPMYYPIVTGSEIIKSLDELTTYIKDTDYTIDYETGALTSITIPDGQTKMSYIYAAYTFEEGVDIVNLGYTIDDNDIYSKVVVYGKDANDAVVFAEKEYVSKDYYNVLSQKFMKIDAPDADTVAKCQAIADRAEMLMRSRVRTVNFAAVAVPWLQVGDLIQVIESSTTISELYRVTDLSTNFDSGGYTMQITCYYHSS